ncbi:copper-binding protein [Alkalimarinus alittae]|uniref:Copper-binding protein n=1 Tax=Alkalimarinus alittae TaxID=2961619 RepID=A0ABY6N2L4_9ALTE|nr:copper-binding protein [Alkalimarinus alittae]UZE96336.1 copper-binding protein [Alkalimarinus alittae]
MKVKMNIRVVVALLMMTLVGCAVNSQPTNSGHGASIASMGQPVREVSAYGFITQVSVATHVVNIKHAPIPEMNWAPMVMNFNVAESVDLSPFKRGDKVQFVLEVDQALNYRIKALSALAN